MEASTKPVVHYNKELDFNDDNDTDTAVQEREGRKAQALILTEKKKKMSEESGLIDTKTQHQPRSRLLSSSKKKRNRLDSSREIITSNSLVLNYDEVALTKREKRDYLKRVIVFENRINALKKQETELSNKMALRQKKEKIIEQIKHQKKRLKAVLHKTKTDMINEKESKKEQVMLQKLEELDKLKRLKQEQKEKKKQSAGKFKSHQLLVKCMITQSNTKTETLNKYKYLQVKEGIAQYQADEYSKSKAKEEQRKTTCLKKINDDKETIVSLRERCNELEKIEGKCFEKLKTTKLLQSSYFQFKSDKGSSLSSKSKEQSTKPSKNRLVNNKKSTEQLSIKVNSYTNILNKTAKNDKLEANSTTIKKSKKKMATKEKATLSKEIITSIKPKTKPAHSQVPKFNHITIRKRNSADEKTLLHSLELKLPSSVSKIRKQFSQKSYNSSSILNCHRNQARVVSPSDQQSSCFV